MEAGARIQDTEPTKENKSELLVTSAATKYSQPSISIKSSNSG
jgi:hypothetical protein